MTDVFNNPSNDYIYPGLAPCANVADDQYLVWTDEGMAVIKGSQEVGSIIFNDLQIPVNSFNKQQVTLGIGEVTFVQGLDKGLCNRKQGFIIPPLTSTNQNQNELFMQIDLSINYYNNFSFTYANIEASANYDQNINIEDALNLVFDKVKIKVTSFYDPSSFTFMGTQEGYEFNISNVKLTLIDTSSNTSSVFPNGANAETYDLGEDASLNINSSKYLNSAMQGIVLRGMFPYDECEEDKWFYVNHVTDYVTTYEPIDINSYVSDVSSFLQIGFDPSTTFGCGIIKPILNYDIFIDDVSISYTLPDVSFGVIDASIDVSTGIIIDGSIVSWRNIYEASIGDSSIFNSNIFDSSAYSSILNTTFILGQFINDSSIINSGINATNILSSSISNSQFLNCDVSSSFIENTLFENSNVYTSNIYDSSLKESTVRLSTLEEVYVTDASLISIDGSNNTFNNILIRTSKIESSDLLSCEIADTSIWFCYTNDSSFGYVDIKDSSIINAIIKNSVIGGIDVSLGIDKVFIMDSSVYSSIFYDSISENVEIGQSTIYNLETVETFIGQSTVNDSSITKGSIINNASNILNSYIEDSWTNTYRLVVYVDPSTGAKTYQYVTEDDTLPIDTSLSTVTITNSEIWDSSINNAILNDCSIYNSYLEDVSLNGCTIYNSDIDPSLYVSTLGSNRIILADPSVKCAVEITYDSSTFYKKVIRKLEVGMSGCSTEELFSAGDYLNWVSTTHKWKKVGDVYIWTTAPDSTDCTIKNLIDGFYVFNPHEFPIQIEYLVFI